MSSPPTYKERPSTLSPRDETFDTRTLANDSHANPYEVSDTKGRDHDFEAGTSHGKRMSDFDEELSHDGSFDKKPRDEQKDSLLEANAVPKTRGDNYRDLEYADPYATNRDAPQAQASGPLTSLMAKSGLAAPSGKYPLQQRIEDKKRGIGRQRHAFIVWGLTIAMIGVFINELLVNNREQGSPLSFKPVKNYMLGPSSSALINLGARYPACMKDVTELPITTSMGCMNNTANPPTLLCSVGELCGFGGIPAGETPNQWFRFILPIFLHAGIIHLLLNMLAQLLISAQVEREMGSGGFLITYFAAGIFGNVLGGNFSLVGIPSVGASGAIFGTLAVKWVDLFSHWRYHYRPVRMLIFMTIELAIGVAIGYIPYIDNFAHIGGFIMGLFVAMIFYPVISPSKRHRLIVWCFRLAAIPVAILLFVILIRNFYTSNPYAACEGCRYLSCIPTSSNNQCKGTGLTTF